MLHMKLKNKNSTADELNMTKKYMGNCKDSTKGAPGKYVLSVDKTIHTSQTTSTKNAHGSKQT